MYDELFQEVKMLACTINHRVAASALLDDLGVDSVEGVLGLVVVTD